MSVHLERHPHSLLRASSASLAGMVVCAVGCASPSGVPSVELAPIEASICQTGTVLQSRASSAEDSRPDRFQVNAATGYRLVGPGTSSLRGLPMNSEAEARLCGVPSQDPDGDATFAPASFRLLNIAGEPAFTGVLAGMPGLWKLEPTTPDEGSGSLTLSAPDSLLAPHAGRRVWVSGELSRDTLQVRRLGAMDSGG